MTSFKSIIQSKIFWSRLLIAVGLFCVFFVGLSIRRIVLHTQIEMISDELPFSLESALHYRRTKMMYDRGSLPAIDKSIQYPEGVRIAEIDSIASEPFYARMAHLFPENVPFHDRMRWIEVTWFCLSMPLLMIAMRVWTGSWIAGFLSGLLYAVSISSVLRSTGQEISRENFAIPWLIASNLFAALFFRSSGGFKQLVWGAVSGVFLAMSLVAWDMIQYVFAVWALGLSIHLLVSGNRYNRPTLTYAAFVTASLLCVGLLHPYYRFHGLVFSPLTAWLVSALVCGLYLHYIPSASAVSDGALTKWYRGRRLRRWGIPVMILIVPILAITVIGTSGAYGSSYEHFAQLLVAKLKFLNVKPDDPSLMTFYQRIMWVPALHSATWVLTKWLFPFTVWLGCCIAVVAFVITRRRPDPLISHWSLLFVVSLATFVLFVRFHVYVSLSCAVLCGWSYGRIAHRSIGWRAALIAILLVATVVEGNHTLKQRQYMGRPNVYYKELKELSDWLIQHVAPDAVLGNIGVSAYAAAYGKCAIVLHPKFEDPSIRNRLEYYGELLFGGNEKALRDWMEELNVKYLIYSYGEFSSVRPEYQMRYFVDKMNPPPTAPARRFERNDETLRYFKRLWGNHKYAVYETFSRDDEMRAVGYARDAIEMLESGKLQAAEALALKALAIDAMQEDALQVMRHVGSLHDQGFQYQGVTEDIQ